MVTKDIPAHDGNPGRVVGKVDKKGHQLEFDESGMSACKKYQQEDDSLIEL